MRVCRLWSTGSSSEDSILDVEPVVLDNRAEVSSNDAVNYNCQKTPDERNDGKASKSHTEDKYSQNEANQVENDMDDQANPPHELILSPLVLVPAANAHHGEYSIR